jgi:hypothetical protein
MTPGALLSRETTRVYLSYGVKTGAFPEEGVITENGGEHYRKGGWVDGFSICLYFRPASDSNPTSEYQLRVGNIVKLRSS